VGHCPICTVLLQRFRRVHEGDGVNSQMIKNEVVIRREIDPNSLIINDIDGSDAGDTIILGWNKVIEVGFYGLGIERRTIMECNALSELERDGFPVREVSQLSANPGLYLPSSLR